MSRFGSWWRSPSLRAGAAMLCRMKTQLKLMLCCVTLLVLLSAPHVASAYYDPGVQRWINRDPKLENGFEQLRHGVRGRPVRSGLSAELGFRSASAVWRGNGAMPEPNQCNLYIFALNEPIAQYDAYGLDADSQHALQCRCLRERRACQIRGGVTCGTLCALAAEGPPCLIACALAYAYVCERQYWACLGGH